MKAAVRSRTWDNGRKERAVSVERKSMTETSELMLLMKFPWLSITPLATPVVPDV